MSKQRTLQWTHETPNAFVLTLGPLLCLTLQSNHLARGPKLPNRAFLSVSEGPRGDAQLESFAGERSGERLVTLLEHNVCVCVALKLSKAVKFLCHRQLSTFSLVILLLYHVTRFLVAWQKQKSYCFHYKNDFEIICGLKVMKT